MSTSFPTSAFRRSKLGQPTRARHCRCLHGSVVHEFECIMCGRLPRVTIEVTWAEQAKRLRGGSWAGTTPRVAARRVLEPEGVSPGLMAA